MNAEELIAELNDPTLTRGRLINIWASLGNRMVQLREEIPIVEKAARKTPARTLLAEIGKVKLAKEALPCLKLELEKVERFRDNVRDDLASLGAFGVR